MPFKRSFNTVGVHCAGETCDIVVGGVRDVPGKTMFEKMMYFWKYEDHLRNLLLNEPRGCSAMCHNLLLPPCNPKADIGFIIMEHEEYPPMSGANTIATATCLLETGIVPMQEPETVLTLDAPAGLVTIHAECSNGKCKSVRFHNVPAFVFALDKEISVPGLGVIKVDIVYSGMIFVLVDAASVGVEIKSSKGAEIIRLGERIKRAVAGQTDPVHPENPEIRGATILEFTGPVTDYKDGKSSTNTVVVSPGRLDRSPMRDWYVCKSGCTPCPRTIGRRRGPLPLWNHWHGVYWTHPQDHQGRRLRCCISICHRECLDHEFQTSCPGFHRPIPRGIQSGRCVASTGQ